VRSSIRREESIHCERTKSGQCFFPFLQCYLWATLALGTFGSGEGHRLGKREVIWRQGVARGRRVAGDPRGSAEESAARMLQRLEGGDLLNQESFNTVAARRRAQQLLSGTQRGSGRRRVTWAMCRGYSGRHPADCGSEFAGNRHVTASTIRATEPRFWRDDALPFIEARCVEDGRKVCYAKHAHETFSIGAISNGHCSYLNGGKTDRVGAGAVVVMNPGEVHACNPIGEEQWGYRMFYIDVPWLRTIQDDLGGSRSCFIPFSATTSWQPELYDGLNRLFAILVDPRVEVLRKHSAAVIFMMAAQRVLGRGSTRGKPPSLARAAEFIRQNCARSVKLQEICAEVDLSASHLIRSFKEVYGLTPHAYQLNCRIELCRSRLRRGWPIADVALAAGFSDQAHLQRIFKRLVAATPGQYRGSRADAPPPGPG
jgi:AraC-like DNA-binding protein